jgi:cytochrome c553
MADMLNGVDVKALAAHYASQRAHRVVYVTLPCRCQ